MTRPLRIVAACSACGLLGEGLTSDPPQTRKPANLKDDWTRWAELDRLAERHTKPGHGVTVGASLAMVAVLVALLTGCKRDGYPDCAAARSAGAAPLHQGDPGYSRSLDTDRDGVACE